MSNTTTSGLGHRLRGILQMLRTAPWELQEVLDAVVVGACKLADQAVASPMCVDPGAGPIQASMLRVLFTVEMTEDTRCFD
ncbi:hypothetical protein [Paraburkholderia sp. RL17-373-BIF-A]|uniref:hypothetical protein n=1 Tax=Paraburkholderia sp. RL17-373-BIF-A TaxID=3031629 RepID=UPI0038B7DE8F